MTEMTTLSRLIPPQTSTTVATRQPAESLNFRRRLVRRAMAGGCPGKHRFAFGETCRDNEFAERSDRITQSPSQVIHDIATATDDILPFTRTSICGCSQAHCGAEKLRGAQTWFATHISTAMAADSRRPQRKRPNFGPIDPFCWFAVAGFLVIAAIGIIGQTVVLTVIALVAAVCLALFDARVNRPEMPPPSRPRTQPNPNRAPRPPQRTGRPAQQPDPRARRRHPGR
jgi:hypothetical protein